MIIFTICSRNFTGYATTLWRSLTRFYPDLKFHMVLCDEVGDFDAAALPFPIVTMDELGIPTLSEMIETYNITELNTALKPFAFMYLFNKYAGQPVIYIDPDIMAFSRFEELEDLFEQGADCVLTPHITEPADFADMGDRQFLVYGVYNLGFCALRDTPETRRVVAWWGRRLQKECIIDLANGVFVDQKWADLLPSFIQNTRILRHPGYNIAYWNLSQRRLSHDDGVWRANGQPIRFVHFSGNKIEDPAIFSRHGGQFTPQNTPVLIPLLDEYRDQIFKNGHSAFTSIEYAFQWEGKSQKNEHTPKAVSADRSRQAHSPHLSLTQSYSMRQFELGNSNNIKNITDRSSIEIDAIPCGDGAFIIEGYCAICQKNSRFQTSSMYSTKTLADGRYIPNWREHLDCQTCGFNNRMRGIYSVLTQEYPPKNSDRIYLTERVTPFFGFLQRKYANTIGSEFFPGDLRGGDVVNGIRHEDLQMLSFENNSFDYIISLDVLEHVPDHQAALRESFRCLSPGGRLLFTVPFSSDHAEEVVRSIMNSDGSIKHLMEPEYHGNPVDMESGALCYRYFGWSVLEHLKQAGFEDAKVISYWSRDLAHLGGLQFVISARKPQAAPGPSKPAGLAH